MATGTVHIKIELDPESVDRAKATLAELAQAAKDVDRSTRKAYPILAEVLAIAFWAACFVGYGWPHLTGWAATVQTIGLTIFALAFVVHCAQLYGVLRGKT